MGLIVWIVAIIFTTFLTIQVTLVYRHWHWLNDHGYRLWIRRSVNLWQYGSDLATIVSLCGYFVIVMASLNRPDWAMRRAAYLLIALPFVAHGLVLAYDYLPGSPLPTTPSMTVAVGPALLMVLIRATYWIAFWGVIVRCVDRRSCGRVWWALVASLVGVLSLIASAATNWYDQAFFRFCTTNSWSGHPWQAYLPWMVPDEWSHVLIGAAQIVVLERFPNQCTTYPQ